MLPTRQRSIIIGLIVAGMLIAGFFGLRAFFAFRDFRRHGHPPHLAISFTETAAETDVELIRDWMTISYIAQTYHVPARMLFDAIGISPRDNLEKSLKQLNEEFFPQTPGFVIELIKAAVRAQLAAPTIINPNTPIPPQIPNSTTSTP